MTMIHISCQYCAEHSPLPYVYFTYKMFREVNLLSFLVTGCRTDTHPTAFEGSVRATVSLSV